MLLGEAGSKVEHLRGVPLRPEAQERLQLIYLAKGAWASAQIEGNTLSEQEAISLLEGELKLPPSREYQAQEIQNIVSAVNAIAFGLEKDGPEPITPGDIVELNRMVLKGLTLDPGVVPGEYRTKSFAVGPYVGAPAEDVEYLMERMCQWLQTNFEPPEDRRDMILVYTIIKAVLAHLYFEWIHPFGDGNGRTGRLIEFHILVSSGVPFPAAHLLSNHYNQTRSEYYRQLRLASVSGGEVVPFIAYAVQGFVDELRSQIEKVHAEQIDVMWENTVHQELPGVTRAAQRRRTLVFELTAAEKPVSRAVLMNFTPAVAQAYATRTAKTLTRDLNRLRGLELIRAVPGGWVANKERMRAFLARSVAT